jgi:protein-L-isoaspartate(D-aspartate) O-methyltransferase
MGDREALIQSLIKDGYLKTPAIIEAFEKIDRKDFVPEDVVDEAYGNYPLPIGYGQTISQPLTVAFMLELLSPRRGEKILDVGSGSGWTSALLAYVVSNAARINADSTRINAEKIGQRESASGPPAPPKLQRGERGSAGYIVAIERIPELKEMAERNVAKYGFIENGVVKIILGDGSKGYAAEAPYNKIIAAAAIASPQMNADEDADERGKSISVNRRRSPRKSVARDAIPRKWKNQLKIGGRIVAPIGQSIVVLDKISEKEFSAEGGPAFGWKEKEYFGFSFVPLVRG